MLCFPILHGKKDFAPGNDGGGGGGAGWADAPLLPPFLYGPDRLSVLKRNWHLQIFIKE